MLLFSVFYGLFNFGAGTETNRFVTRPGEEYAVVGQIRVVVPK